MIKEPLKLEYDENIKIDSKIFIYFIMFLLSLLVIFRVIPYVFGLIIIFMLAFIFNKKAILTMDWDVILTFCAFFIFSGNVSRISFISDVLVLLLDKSTLLTGLLSCQFISNVPSAILLSKFTVDYHNLVVAVNIGSLGTLISSLASLITLKHYLKGENKFFEYILMYTVINIIFLAVLILYMFIIN